MLTDKELNAIVQTWGNEPAQRTIIDLCRDVARAQEAAERERLLGELRQMHAAQKGRHNYYLYAAEMLAANL